MNSLQLRTPAFESLQTVGSGFHGRRTRLERRQMLALQDPARGICVKVRTANVHAFAGKSHCPRTVSSGARREQKRGFPLPSFGHVARYGASVENRKHLTLTRGFKSDTNAITSRQDAATVDDKTSTQKSIAEKLWPYAQLARLDKPAGLWLSLAAHLWGICLATDAGSLPDPQLLGLFALVAFFQRCACCTVNDIWDMDFDMQVARTNTRPLASGALSRSQGIAFYLFELLLLTLTSLPVTNLGRILIAIEVVLFAIYPTMKRLTYWPSSLLSVATSWSILAVWGSIRGNLNGSPMYLPLTATIFLWTVFFDTMYTHQDKKDDKEAGVKSVALFLAENTKIVMAGVGALCLGSLTLGGSNANLGWPFYVGAAAAGAQLAWQLITVNLDEPRDCAAKFASNKWFGLIVLLALVGGRWAAPLS